MNRAPEDRFSKTAIGLATLMKRVNNVARRLGSVSPLPTNGLGSGPQRKQPNPKLQGLSRFILLIGLRSRNSVAQSAVGGTWQPARRVILIAFPSLRFFMPGTTELRCEHEIALLAICSQQVSQDLSSHRQRSPIGIPFLFLFRIWVFR